jgi:hypothetical protein
LSDATALPAIRLVPTIPGWLWLAGLVRHVRA